MCLSARTFEWYRMCWMVSATRVVYLYVFERVLAYTRMCVRVWRRGGVGGLPLRLKTVVVGDEFSLDHVSKFAWKK